MTTPTTDTGTPTPVRATFRLDGSRDNVRGPGVRTYAPRSGKADPWRDREGLLHALRLRGENLKLLFVDDKDPVKSAAGLVENLMEQLAEGHVAMAGYPAAGDGGTGWLLLGVPEDVLAPHEEWAEKPYVLTLHRHWNHPGSTATASEPQDATGLLLSPVTEYTIPSGAARAGLADWLTAAMPELADAWWRCRRQWDGGEELPEPTWVERSPRVRPSERSIQLRVFVDNEAEPRDRPAVRGHDPEDIAADLITFSGPPTEGILFAVGPAKQPNLMGVLVTPPGTNPNWQVYSTHHHWVNGRELGTIVVWDDPWRLCRYLAVTLEGMLIRVEQAYRTGQSIRSPVATGDGTTEGE